MSRQFQAYVYAMTAVVLWSTAATAFKLTLRYTDTVTLLFYSSLVAALVLLGLLLIQGRWQALSGQFRRANRAALAWSVLAGFLNPLLYYLILFQAYRRLPAQEAQPLNFTWPVVLSLLAALVFREKIRPAAIVALLISFSGVLVISTRGDILAFRPADPVGAMLAVGSAFIWATYWLINMKDEREEVLKLGMAFGVGFVLTAALAAVLFRFGDFGSVRWLEVAGTTDPVGPDLRLFVFPYASWPALLGCVYIGLFEMGITFVLWLKALRLSDTTARVSNLIYLAPFLSLILIRFVVGEPILYTSLIGLAIIVGGLILQSRAGSGGG
jgi:drug/metabolite transporter (DMT)-like permease